MDDSKVVLRLEHVTRRYDSPAGPWDVQVLDDLSLTLAEGESVAVTGPSGSGKSTLLNIMGGLDRPTSGSVLLDGRDLSSLSDDELAVIRNGEIGFIFQMHHLLPQCTVMENVLVPTLPFGKGDRRDRAAELLERVGLADRSSHRPAQLSGGESLRAAVARALINEPKLVLADEPTGSLDRENAENLVKLLEELHAECGTTLVMVTHSEELAGRMGKMFRLSGGRLEKL